MKKSQKSRSPHTSDDFDPTVMPLIIRTQHSAKKNAFHKAIEISINMVVYSRLAERRMIKTM